MYTARRENLEQSSFVGDDLNLTSLTMILLPVFSSPEPGAPEELIGC